MTQPDIASIIEQRFTRIANNLTDLAQRIACTPELSDKEVSLYVKPAQGDQWGQAILDVTEPGDGFEKSVPIDINQFPSDMSNNLRTILKAVDIAPENPELATAEPKFGALIECDCNGVRELLPLKNPLMKHEVEDWLSRDDYHSVINGHHSTREYTALASEIYERNSHLDQEVTQDSGFGISA